MRFKLTQRLASALAIGATAFLAMLAEGQTDPVREGALGPDQVMQPLDDPKPLTGKERLGNKWMDEQRVDNCKVPIDKRGTKPRRTPVHVRRPSDPRHAAQQGCLW